MAGLADELADEAQAAVDRCDHAQRQVQLVQHRALLDVDFDETEVVRRIALEIGDVVDIQTRLLHGLAHGDAIRILLVEPARIEVADQCAGRQEGGLEALAFLFGEGHDFNIEGQPNGPARQLLDAHDGHEDAQSSVVLAAVAHGVVMAAGEQRFRFALRHELVRAQVTPDHVAHGVDVHLIEPRIAHGLRKLRRAGAVCIGQVGHRELPVLGKAGVAVPRQRLVPIPHLLAQQRFDAELVGQSNLGDAVDIAQRLGALHVRMVAHAPREGVDDLALAQARAARPAHGQDEGKAEARVVVGVQLLDARELLGRAVGEAGLALLVGRFGRERLRDHGLARQLGVGADQRELLLGRAARQRLRHRVLQVRKRLKGPFLQGFGRDPRRVLVQAVEHARRFFGRGGIELVEGDGHAHS